MGKHHHQDDLQGRRLLVAVAVNLGLTVVQVAGGIIAGSLALIADALHNFSDAASLLLALLARRIALRPADDVMTYGYGRAEIVAALINFTMLIMIGIFLFYEAIAQAVNPEPIAGWIVVIVAGVALVIDLITVWLTHSLAKDSMNIRAAFIHNLTDAMASLGVIVAGTLIILFDWYLADAIITLCIAGYVMSHGISEIGGAIRILMSGTPTELKLSETIAAIETVEGVEAVDHVHLWSIDEHRRSLEAQIVTHHVDATEIESLKAAIRDLLRQEFNIDHATLELEFSNGAQRSRNPD